MPRSVDRGGALVSLRDRLGRLLESGQVAGLVPRLPAETLHQLIRYRGLDASAEILASATPDQVTSILDLDLWRSPNPAADEQFDRARFGEWVEALVEAGDDVAARTVAAIDERLVTAGLSGHIRVLDPATCMPASSTDDDAMEHGSTRFSGLASEVGGYLVRARRTDAWDAIVALLLALDANHRDYFHAVMRGCRRLSNSAPEIDGLDGVLAGPEQLLHDLGLAREGRRTEQGYLTPADARAFLHAARQPATPRAGRPSSLDAIAADYLRAREERPAAGEESTEAELRQSIRAVAELLAEAGLVPERPRALLAETPGTRRSASTGREDRPSPVARIRALMEHLCAADERAFLARSRELAFLANALMAGCSVQARPFTAQEASDAAVAACNLGLEHWADRSHEDGTAQASWSAADCEALPDSLLADHDLVTVFHVGWRALHETSMHVADRLVAILRALRCSDLETQLGLDVLRRTLARQHEAGTPWLARDALDAIAVLDVSAWAGLLGVLDECPVLPAALTAALEGQTGPVSATAFDFISTKRQIGEVRLFMGRLADILVR